MKYAVRFLMGAAILMVAGFTVAALIHQYFPPAGGEPMLTQAETEIDAVSYDYDGWVVKLDMQKDCAVVDQLYRSIQGTKTQRESADELSYDTYSPLLVVAVQYRNGKEDVIFSDNTGKRICRILNIGPPADPLHINVMDYSDKNLNAISGGNTGLAKILKQDEMSVS